jgi:hypothetical protein
MPIAARLIVNQASLKLQRERLKPLIEALRDAAPKDPA